MAQSDVARPEPASATHKYGKVGFFKKLFGRDYGASGAGSEAAKEPRSEDEDDPARPGLLKRASRKVVPGLPRVQTFKRQQSELRTRLEPVQPTPAERRAVSADRRLRAWSHGSQSFSNPRTSAPDFLRNPLSSTSSVVQSQPGSPLSDKVLGSIGEVRAFEPPSEDPQILSGGWPNGDIHSETTSLYDERIHFELETIWILNLSMHFRDRSQREKFFVTYRQSVAPNEMRWRRVTISLDYRDCRENDNSLESDLKKTRLQRDKSAKIYEAIRESLPDIQFYESVTNLKLQTTDGRLHVHVVEDTNEIIPYPTVSMVEHLRCRLIKEGDLRFDSHMSGFVYKVGVHEETLIKKEIPGPDTVDEFLYEVNALNRLRDSQNVIKFYGLVVDDNEELVKGLLISYAPRGALVDIIYDSRGNLLWPTREKWARQIVQGLSEIHEAGFVQGDFTLSNIVIDDDDNAKIIDINRRGCPVGWEPPEATPLIESNQRISLYIGVKSDLFQLGMVLWALAMVDDEPEAQPKPLQLDHGVSVPGWYRRIVQICLSEDPRNRIQALHLSPMFPDADSGLEPDDPYYRNHHPSLTGNDDAGSQRAGVSGGLANGSPRIMTVKPPRDWSASGDDYGHSLSSLSDESSYYPTRGRSPPRRLPPTYDSNGVPQQRVRQPWPGSSHADIAASVCDVAPDDSDGGDRSGTPRTIQRSVLVEGENTVAVVELSLEQDSGQTAAEDQDATPGPENSRGLEETTAVEHPIGIISGAEGGKLDEKLEDREPQDVHAAKDTDAHKSEAMQVEQHSSSMETPKVCPIHAASAPATGTGITEPKDQIHDREGQSTAAAAPAAQLQAVDDEPVHVNGYGPEIAPFPTPPHEGAEMAGGNTADDPLPNTTGQDERTVRRVLYELEGIGSAHGLHPANLERPASIDEDVSVLTGSTAVTEDEPHP